MKGDFKDIFGKGRSFGEVPSIPDDIDDLPVEDSKAPFQVVGGKFLTSLWVYFNAEERKKHGRRKRQFQYRNLDDDDSSCGFLEDGSGFSVIFSGHKRHRLTVKGRGDLEKLYNLISIHRVMSIRCTDQGRDFGADGTVITSITIEDLQEQEIEGFITLK